MRVDLAGQLIERRKAVRERMKKPMQPRDAVDIAIVLTTEQEVDISILLRRVLKELDSMNVVPCKVDDIKKLVAEKFHINWLALRGNGAVIKIIRPRMIAIYLSRLLTNLSIRQISRLFGLHHSSVIKCVKRTAELIQDDDEMFDMVLRIAKRVRYE